MKRHKEREKEVIFNIEPRLECLSSYSKAKK